MEFVLKMKNYIIDHRAWMLPVLAMLILTPLTPFLDLEISRYFYHTSGFQSNAFWTFLFNYGPYPAHFTAIAALFIFTASFFFKTWRRWRAPALVLMLTMAIGAGLIVHAALKDHWGRPRPKQTIEFGGTQHFRAYYEPNFSHQPEPSKSFSCGHCSMGFYFFALALVGRRMGSPALFYIGIGFAVVLGILLSLTRIAQGGHFFSDTLISALIMWLTAYVCTQCTFGQRSRFHEEVN